MTPPIDLAAVRKLSDAATPGPWQECGHERGGCQCGFVWSIAADALLLMIRARDEDVPTADEAHCRSNAKFIAEARTLVPAMADEIEALREKLRAAREALDAERMLPR